MCAVLFNSLRVALFVSLFVVASEAFPELRDVVFEDVGFAADCLSLRMWCLRMLREPRREVISLARFSFAVLLTSLRVVLCIYFGVFLVRCLVC